MNDVVVGLGGNVGDVLGAFRRAREAFAEIGHVTSAPVYRTAAIGPAQPPYLNSALRVRWPDVTAGELIATVLEIEHLLGRDRRGEARWGPRTIDLDVLVWGPRVVREPGLEVPHPRLAERRFAIVPLIALVGSDFVVPGTHDMLGALEQRVHAQQLDEINSSW
ncbi:MAG: 2-amino-4-hydroxy-6-hydroxymethyldihydropteridine diphosphokinase [Deltaproteobacteria bacterium]|nr:2-amino-4-hydroxy-6-hydroxymethyldihydropteridine diphosphokinase [Deltaproteobacteria bacterium]